MKSAFAILDDYIDHVIEEHEKAKKLGNAKEAPITEAALESIKNKEQTLTDNRGLFTAMYGACE